MGQYSFEVSCFFLSFAPQTILVSQSYIIIILHPHLVLMLQTLINPACFCLTQILLSTVTARKGPFKCMIHQVYPPKLKQ